MTVRVMVSARVEEKDQGAFEEAYRQVTSVVRGTPGHLRDELLRDAEQPGRYILLAEWESEEAFRTWEDAPSHREMAAPMFPYWSGGDIERRIFDLRARLDSVPSHT
ncbi:antibiotic biosynthesis monooxygenase [Streptomyces sp. NBC_00347]|uniref:antibiotic biosynthesis monooxygenase family protein n=1 Tax=Streptomyces sp. NBC_00347 TaxID=2975721 RepID=UPI002251281C|nr:antibiotic biosynthesis monooxygenase family protein [Streptomyces sp. NBC_00347]MCX5126143.1 antibiotic biosynthesis monooxygenase [Streptomyces sp. NBC_00347]